MPRGGTVPAANRLMPLHVHWALSVPNTFVLMPQGVGCCSFTEWTYVSARAYGALLVLQRVLLLVWLISLPCDGSLPCESPAGALLLWHQPLFLPAGAHLSFVQWLLRSSVSTSAHLACQKKGRAYCPAVPPY